MVLYKPANFRYALGCLKGQVNRLGELRQFHSPDLDAILSSKISSKQFELTNFCARAVQN